MLSQAEALHTTGTAAEKRVHFDQIDGLFEKLGIGKELMEQVGKERRRGKVEARRTSRPLRCKPVQRSGRTKLS